MRAPLRTRLHRLSAATAALALSIIGVTSTPPAATAAPESRSVTSSFEFDIHEQDTFDMTFTMRNADTPPSLYCDKDLITVDDSTADVTTRVQGDQCVLSIFDTNIDGSKNGEGLNIRHEGSTYVFEASDLSGMKGIGATIKVTWSDIDTLSSLRAEGEDSAGNPAPDKDKSNGGSIGDRSSQRLFWAWIIAGGVAALVTGGVIALIVLNRRRTHSDATAPVSARDLSRTPAQPGYTQSGYGYTQPGPGQPGQQPYNPSTRH